MALRDFALTEARFAMLDRTQPERAEHLLGLAQADADERWRFYQQLAEVERTVPHATTDAQEKPEAAQPGSAGEPDAPEEN
jgi:pyruvate-ferredoxin/flavodoxin oxidoreductase